MMSLMVKPPKPGDASYDTFMKEEGDIHESLKRRAKILVEGLIALTVLSATSLREPCTPSRA